MRRLATFLLVLASSLLLVSPAAAVDTDAVLHFEGSITVTDLTEQTQYGTFPASAVIECSAADCVATISTTDQGITILLADAVPITPDGGTFAQPAVGDVCNDDEGWLDASDVTIGFTGSSITFSRDSLGSGEKDCPDGSTVQWDSAHVEGSATFTEAEGDACGFFGGCEFATPSGDSVVRYEGTAHLEYPAFPGQPRDYPVHVEFDCKADPCAVTASLFGGERDVSLVGPSTLDFSGPSDSWQLDAYGDNCHKSSWAGAGSLSLEVDGETLQLTRTSAAGACPDGLQQEYPEFTATATLTRVSGDLCLLDGSCTPAVTLHAVEADDPSVLSALTTPAAAAEPANLLWAAAVATVLVLLVAFPTHLLNSAIEHGTERAGAWWRARRAATALRVRNGWPVAALGLVAASVISGFVSPDFGFNAASIRVFASILLSFVLEAVVGWLLVIWLVRRLSPDATPSIRFAPLTLLIVAAAVLFTRLTGFQPGIVFGLVAGVTFGAALATSGKAKAALATLGVAFGLAVLAWIGYGLLDGVEGAGLVFVRETLSSVAIGGIAALPIALVPLRGLTGYEVFAWKRWAWITAYAVGLLSFFLVLMPRPFSWAEVPLSIGAWIGIYLAYAAVAVGLWLALVRPWTKSPES